MLTLNECYSRESGTSVRWCIWPDCPNHLDLTNDPPATFQGWHHSTILGHGYLCPAHSASPHLPARTVDRTNPEQTTVTPRCDSGWTGDPATTMGAALEQWRTHLDGLPS